jgi:hypothetical protein
MLTADREVELRADVKNAAEVVPRPRSVHITAQLVARGPTAQPQFRTLSQRTADKARQLSFEYAKRWTGFADRGLAASIHAHQLVMRLEAAGVRNFPLFRRDRGGYTRITIPVSPHSRRMVEICRPLRCAPIWFRSGCTATVNE